MPQVHVVRERADLASVAASLMRPRASKADREATLTAIVGANPGLSAESIVEAGVVVIIPPDAKVAAADDPLGSEIDDLVLRVRLGIADLAAASDAGDERRKAIKTESQRLMSSSAVRRMAEADPRMAAAVEEGRADLRDADTQAKKGGARLGDAKEQWNSELDGLVALLRQT